MRVGKDHQEVDQLRMHGWALPPFKTCVCVCVCVCVSQFSSNVFVIGLLLGPRTSYELRETFTCGDSS